VSKKVAFTWRDDLETGIPLIDEQHRLIISEINGLVETVTLKKSPPDVEAVFHYLTKYATEHFQTEETYMLQYAYPKLQEHHAIHQGFMSEFDVMLRAVRASYSPIIVVQVAARIRMELMKHIETVDLPMAVFLRAKVQG
jgi:hemerythrin-like metal-binding protein